MAAYCPHCLSEVAGRTPWPAQPERRAQCRLLIGEVAVPDSILFKPEPLDAAERSLMERHAEGDRQEAGPGMTAARCVLIVDDDPFIRKLVATTLEGIAGFQLHQAKDGLEALHVAAEHPPAIVFLDVSMPRLGGIETAARLRAIPACAGATIVMLTAAGPERERAARGAGADVFLTKPFSPLDLLHLVDELGAPGLTGAA